jgi:hypothetical protein
MPFVKLHNVTAHSPIGSLEQHYGYSCEVREDGLYADVPESLIETELASGRVRATSTEETKVEETQEVEKEIKNEADEPKRDGKEDEGNAEQANDGPKENGTEDAPDADKKDEVVVALSEAPQPLEVKEPQPLEPATQPAVTEKRRGRPPISKS